MRMYILGYIDVRLDCADDQLRNTMLKLEPESHNSVADVTASHNS